MTLCSGDNAGTHVLCNPYSTTFGSKSCWKALVKAPIVMRVKGMGMLGVRAKQMIVSTFCLQKVLVLKPYVLDRLLS